MLLFAAGDVGGARALIPIMELCAHQDIPFSYVHHGYLAEAAQDNWQRRSQIELTPEALAGSDITCCLFATSVSDTLALTLARSCKNAGIPTVHILDHWSAYAERMCLDGRKPFEPDVYFVPDELARNAALAAGISSDKLSISGQPALAYCPKENSELPSLSGGRPLFLFISEPVQADHGRWRGYTEEEVLQLVCHQLQPYANKLHLAILPHPREDKHKLAAIWKRHKGELQGDIRKVTRGADLLPLAKGVIGMASILLYEAWLSGLPVASVQPGVCQPPLRMLEDRQDLLFIDAAVHAHKISAWVEQSLTAPRHSPRNELRLHQTAAQTILTTALRLTPTKKQ